MLNLFSILWGINVFLQRNYFTFLTESLKTLPSYSDLNRCPNFLEVWKPFGTKTEQTLRWGLITKRCWVTPLLPQPRTPAFVKTCTGLPRQPLAIALIKYSRIVFSFLFDWDFIHKKILIWVFHQWEKIVLLLFQKAMLTIHYTNICSFATVTRYSWSILINFVIGNSALELFSRVICYLRLSQHRHSQLKSDKDKARPCLYYGYHSVNKSCCGFLFCFQLQALMTVCSRWQMNTHIHMLQKLIPSSNICLSGSIDRAKVKSYELKLQKQESKEL